VRDVGSIVTLGVVVHDGVVGKWEVGRTVTLGEVEHGVVGERGGGTIVVWEVGRIVAVIGLQIPISQQSPRGQSLSLEQP
jgi:hypothetical protein